MNIQPAVMIIDSNRAFVMYAGLLLKRLGYLVRACSGGAEGLKALETFRPDLLIIDAGLKTSGGEPLLQKLSSDSAISRIPFIIVTVSTSAKEEKLCRDLGCIDYLAKPLSLDRLHSALLKIGGPNRRRHLRALFERKIRVYYGGKREEMFALNLSEGGVFLRKMTPLPAGTELEMKFRLNDEGEELCLKGRVIHTKELFHDGKVNDPGMAVQFYDLDNDDAATMRHYIKTILTKDLVEQQEEKVLLPVRESVDRY